MNISCLIIDNLIKNVVRKQVLKFRLVFYTPPNHTTKFAIVHCQRAGVFFFFAIRLHKHFFC